MDSLSLPELVGEYEVFANSSLLLLSPFFYASQFSSILPVRESRFPPNDFDFLQTPPSAPNFPPFACVQLSETSCQQCPGKEPSLLANLLLFFASSDNETLCSAVPVLSFLGSSAFPLSTEGGQIPACLKGFLASSVLSSSIEAPKFLF